MTSGPQSADGCEHAHAVAGAFSRLESLRRGWESRSELCISEMRLLWLLRDEQAAWTMRSIAEALGLEQSTVNRQVNAAVAAGRVERFRERGHASYLFRRTPEGVATFTRGADAVLGRYAEALAGLGEDAAAFTALLERFTDLVVSLGPEPPAEPG